MVLIRRNLMIVSSLPVGGDNGNEGESLFPAVLSTGSNGQTGVDIYEHFVTSYTANKPNNASKNSYTKTTITESLTISNIAITNVNTYVTTWGKKKTANGIIFSNSSTYYVLSSDGTVTNVTF